MKRFLDDGILFLKYRPKKIDDFICSEGFKTFMKEIVDGKEFPHILLSGIHGTGKTSFAKMIVDLLNADYLFINGSKETGVDMVRTKINNFCSSRANVDSDYKYKIVIIDEMERLSVSAQSSLKSDMETFSTTTKFILTTNNPLSIIPEIRDRIYKVELGNDLSKEMKKEYFHKLIDIMKKENIKYTGDKKNIVSVLMKGFPSFRYPINLIQMEAIKGSNKIDFDKLANRVDENEDFSDTIIKFIKEKNIQEAHKFICEYGGNINLTQFYKTLSDRLFDLSDDGEEILEMGKQISDKYFQSYTTNVKEVNIMGIVFTLIMIKE